MYRALAAADKSLYQGEHKSMIDDVFLGRGYTKKWLKF